MAFKNTADDHLSSMESELVALAQANQAAIALRRLLHELGFEQQSATVIGEDNASCIKYIYGSKRSTNSKHIGVKFYFVKDHIKDGTITVKKVPTADNVADIMTKSLGSILFKRHMENLGMQDCSSH